MIWQLKEYFSRLYINWSSQQKTTNTRQISTFFYINRLTNIHCLCISLSVARDILAIAYSEGYQRFSHCYKIITCFWFIYSLTKLFYTFICYYFQCLALQTRWHTLYGLLSLIKSPLVPFFTQTLDFVLMFLLFKEEYNTLMSVTCKFSKYFTLIKDVNTWLMEQWVHGFLNRLDLINWGLLGELITNWDLKFLNKFWIALFTKLKIKLLYSTAYHLQINGSSEHINQIIEIAL